jgi:hypothetical protein
MKPTHKIICAKECVTRKRSISIGSGIAQYSTNSIARTMYKYPHGETDEID